MHHWSQVFLVVLVFNLACRGLAIAQNKDRDGQHFFEQGEMVERTNPQVASENYWLALKKAGTEDRDLQVRSLMKLMSLDLRNGESDSIRKWSEMISHSLLSKNSKDSLAAAFFLSSAKFYDVPLAETELAITNYKRALKINLRLFGETSESVASCYLGIADVYKYRSYDFTNAEKNYEKALFILEKSGSKNSRLLAENYYSLATTNRSQQDYEKAISYGLRAIEIIKTLHDNIFLERSYSIIANIYRDMKEYDLANRYYSMAIELNFTSNGKKKNEDQAWNFRGKGESQMKQRNYTEAIRSFEETLNIYRGIDHIRDQQLYIYTLQKLGEAYFALNRHSDSYNFFRKAGISQFIKTLANQFKIRILRQKIGGVVFLYMIHQVKFSAGLLFSQFLPVAIPCQVFSDTE